MKRFIKFLFNWNEVITLPLAMILWYYSADLIRFFDPTAAAYDGGIFQIILFTVIQVLVYNAVAWLIIKITFPDIYKYLDSFLEANLKLSREHITVWEKSKIALWLFTLYFLALVVLARVLYEIVL